MLDLVQSDGWAEVCGSFSKLQWHLWVCHDGQAPHVDVSILLSCSPQVLFRPVAMVVPDYQIVAEVMLFSEGFDTAPWLAGKMVHLYKLASEQLSQQVSSGADGVACIRCMHAGLLYSEYRY